MSVVTLLTDYGTRSEFAGICHGVIRRMCPGVEIVDITHAVPRHDIRHGALVLRNALPYMPVGVHMAVVDPQVGTERRAIALQTGDGSLLVGPDNGLLSLAWLERGGVTAAHELANPALWRESVHKTFRGRDVFAPVAAHLAAGTPLTEVGPQVEISTLTTLPPREVEVDDDHVHAEVSLVDHFGNVSLNVDRAALEAAGMRFGDTVEVRCNGRTLAVPFTATYGDVSRGRLTLCEDSFRAVMLAVNAGHASQELRVTRGEPIVIARLPQVSAP